MSLLCRFCLDLREVTWAKGGDTCVCDSLRLQALSRTAGGAVMRILIALIALCGIYLGVSWLNLAATAQVSAAATERRLRRFLMAQSMAAGIPSFSGQEQQVQHRPFPSSSSGSVACSPMFRSIDNDYDQPSAPPLWKGNRNLARRSTTGVDNRYSR